MTQPASPAPAAIPGNPPPSAPPSPSGQPSGGQPSGDSGQSWTSGLNETTRGFVELRGFKDPQTLAESYINLEKLMGVPKDRIVHLPEKEDDVDGWNKVHSRLGRPEKEDDYPTMMPEKGGDPELAKFAKNIFFKAGLSKKQAEVIGKAWNEFNDGVRGQMTEAHVNKVKQEEAALKSEWGAAWGQNLEIAKRAATKFGVTGETIDQLEKVMGFGGVIKLFHQLGAGVGVSMEDSFVGGNTSAFGGRILTPAAAKARIGELKLDADFVRRYTSGEANAKAEMNRLHEMAYPDEQP